MPDWNTLGPRCLAVLTALVTNPHMSLGDLVYDVREREGLGWDGPAVKAWSDAVTEAQAVIRDANSS